MFVRTLVKMLVLTNELELKNIVSLQLENKRLLIHCL